MENGHQPATKAELAAVKQDVVEVKHEVAEVKQDVAMLRSEMHHAFDDLKETMRDTQTELLKVFYGYMQTTDVKLRDNTASDAYLRERLTVVEQRLSDLERKVNFPNQ